MQCLRLSIAHNAAPCSSLRSASGARLAQASRPALAAARAARPACSAAQQPPQQQLQQQQQQLAAQRPAGSSGAAPSAAALAALWTLAAQLPASAAEVELSGGPPASSYYVSLGLFLITVPGAAAGCCLAVARFACCALASATSPPCRRPLGPEAQAAHEPSVAPLPQAPSSSAAPRPGTIVSERPSARPPPSPPAGLWSLIKRSPKAKIKRKTFEVAGPAEVRRGGLRWPAVWRQRGPRRRASSGRPHEGLWEGGGARR